MGILRLISVPIGNLEDITARAKNAFENERIFYVEDTRTFFSLLNHLGIQRTNLQVDSFHDQSINKIPKIIHLLNKGEVVNIVSEAGSPLISDPAYPLIKEAINSGHSIESFPGVSSVIVALELSGLPVHPFKFHGFFPRKKQDLKAICHNIQEEICTNVFFESPYRLISTLKILKENLLGEIDFVVCRELTKKFETIYRFDLTNIDSFFSSYMPKGEIVVCVYNKEVIKHSIELSKLSEMAKIYMNKPTKKSISKLLALLLKKSSKEIYLELGEKLGERGK